MSKFINLSTVDQEDLVGAIYDIIEAKSGVELENEHYDKIEESVSTLLDYLNEQE